MGFSEIPGRGMLVKNKTPPVLKQPFYEFKIRAVLTTAKMNISKC